MSVKAFSVLTLALLCLAVAGAWAQTVSASSQPKIGVINLQRAIASSAEGKKASAELQNKFAREQSGLQAMQKQLQDLQNRITNNRTLSDTELTRLQRQAELLTRQFQRKQDGLNEAVDAAQSEVMGNIGPRMQTIIERYSGENGYTLVLNAGAAGTPVLWGTNQINITDDIIRLFDQSYPVKGAAGSSAHTNSSVK